MFTLLSDMKSSCSKLQMKSWTTYQAFCEL